MARAPAAEAEIAAYDHIDGWPAPEQRTDWYGEAGAEQALLEAYRSGRIHHAWLIGGPKGIGKATLAYRFARFVLAHPDPSSADVAQAHDLSLASDHPAFRKVANRAHPNLLVLQRPWDFEGRRFRTQLLVERDPPDEAPFFGTTGGEDGWRVAIVDPADDMNPNAANALLKVLEEPPERGLFLMVSHAPGRLLPTIRSRSRRLELKPLPEETILRALRASAAESNVASGDLSLAAALAGGSLRRAIVLVEEGIALYRALPPWSPACLKSTWRQCTPSPIGSAATATSRRGRSSGTWYRAGSRPPDPMRRSQVRRRCRPGSRPLRLKGGRRYGTPFGFCRSRPTNTTSTASGPSCRS